MASPEPATPDLRDEMVKCMTNMGTPRGFMRVRESMVLDHGFTAERARAWVIEQGGRVESEGPRERTDVGLRPGQRRPARRNRAVSSTSYPWPW